MDDVMTPASMAKSSDFDLYADRGDALVRSMIALIVLSTSFVFLRLLSRKVAHAGYWWDDVLVVAALFLSLVNPALNIAAVDHTGFGKHVARFGLNAETHVINSTRILFTFQIFFALSTGVIKLCIIVFYRRILPARQLRTVLFAISAVVISFTIAVVLLTVFQCTPISKYWDRSRSGSCLDIYNVLMVTGSINTALNFTVVLLPVPLLWQLRTSKRQKCLLTFVFLIAGFVVVVSILRLAFYAKKYNGNDITWHSADVTLWSATEPCAGIMCACIPSLRPLITSALRAVHIKLPTFHRSPSSVTRRPGSASSHLLWIMDAKERASSDAESQLPQNTLQNVPSAIQTMQSRKAYAGKRPEHGFSVAEIEVPYGAINVKTEIRWSVQDRYEYDYRVY